MASERLNILLSLKSVVQDGQKTLNWLKSFTGMISGAGGALAMFAAKQSIAFGAQITTLAGQAEMGAKALQVLTLEGEKSGVKMADISKAATVLRKNLQDARAGSTSMTAALKTLNLSAAGLQSLAPERQWERIGGAINNATDRQAALNAATDLFGAKNIPHLLSILKTLGVDGYDKIAASVESIVLSDEQLAKLETAANAWARIQSSIKLAAAHATSYTIKAFAPDSDLQRARAELSPLAAIESESRVRGQKLSEVMVQSIRVAREKFIEELVKVGGDQLLLAENEIAKLQKMQKAAAPTQSAPTLTSADTGFGSSYYDGIPGVIAPKKKAGLAVSSAPSADPTEEAVKRLTDLLAKRREDDAAAAADAARRKKEQDEQMAAAQKIAEAEARTKKLREEGVKAAEAIKKHTFDQATAANQLSIKQGELAELLKKYEEETAALIADGATQEDLQNREKIFLAKKLEIMGEILGIQKKITSETEKTAGTKFNASMDSLASGRAQVQGNPFMTSRGKSALLRQSYGEENTRIAGELARIDAARADPGADQAALETRRNELTKRRDDNTLKIQDNTPLDVTGELRKQLVDLNDQLGSTEQMMGRAFGSVMQGNIDVLSGGIRGLLDGTLTWGDALRQIGTGIIDNVINAISQMFAEWITSRLTASAVSQAASVEEGATATIAAAPAATLTSIYSWGAAAAIGLAAVVAAMAMFDTGGYTGDGGRYQPAGLVHKGEVVFENPIVKGQEREIMSLRAALQAGVPARDLLAGAGYADGGYAGGGADFRPIIVGSPGRARGGEKSKPVRNIFTDNRRLADELAGDPAFDNRIVNLVTKKRRRLGFRS